MKILIVITKADIGGAQVFVLNLASKLKQRGYDVDVAAGTGDFLFAELKKKGVNYYYLDELKRNFSILDSLYFIKKLYQIMKHSQYDLIHLNSSNTLISAISVWLLKIKPKFLFTFHGLSFLDKNYSAIPGLKGLVKLYFKIFATNVDECVFVSAVNKEESIKSKITNKGVVIYNGLDLKENDFLSNEEARKFISEKCNYDLNGNFVIGSTGRLAYQKNYEFLITNFDSIKNKYPGIKFVIIGDGPDLEKLKALVNNHNCKEDIFFAGAIKDSHKYIKAFDVFTLPSRYEGLSISLIEAIFAGIPILASDVGGNVEVVGENSNQLYELDNISDYLQKLEYIKNHIESVKENNSKRKELFLLDGMVDSYIKVYKDLVESKK
ncbi:MAG: glycosyltransferase [Melioribacteraceae bacterium]